MSFTQGAPTQPMSILASNVFLTGSSTAGNAFTVQQLGAGNVASFQTSTSSTSLIINPSGNVGIGKTNPGYALDVTGDINFTGTFRQNGSAYIGSQWTGTSTLYFAGNVGINTTSVTNPLTIGGSDNATVVQFSTPNSYLNFIGNNRLGTNKNSWWTIDPNGTTAGDQGLGIWDALAVNGYCAIGTYSSSTIGPTNGLIVSGNVGIGVTNPACALSFGSTTNNKILCLYDGNTSDSVSTGYSFYGFGVNSNYLRFQACGSGTTPSDGFYWYSANTERMRIQATTGNVGIGTNNPSKLLHVWGGMIIGASSDSRATTVTLNAPGATVTFSPNADIGDGARIMCLQCPDLSSTTANLVSFSLQVAPTGSFGSQRTSLDLKGFRVASQSYGGFCITSPFDSGGSYDLFYADRTKAYFQQNVGIGTASPNAKLDVWTGTARSGTAPASYGAIYATADGGGGITYPPIAEFRHSNQTQGIGINFNAIFATGSNAAQPLYLYSRGASEVQIVGSGVGGSGYGNLLVDYPNSGSAGGCITLRNSSGGTNCFASLVFELDGSTATTTTSVAPVSFTQGNGMLYCQNTGGPGNNASKMGFIQWNGGSEVETVTILPTGHVGIGTATPAFRHHVYNGDSSFSYYGPNATWSSYLIIGAGTNQRASGRAQVISTNGNLHMDAGTGQIMYLNFYSAGDGVGCECRQYGALNVTGDVTAFYSDERLKTKVGLIENPLDKVCSLTAFKYVHNEIAKSVGFEGDGVQVGLSAQEVQNILPEVVARAPFDEGTVYDVGIGKSKSGQDYLTLKYERLVPLLVEALKEERTERLKVEERLARLEKLLLKE